MSEKTVSSVMSIEPIRRAKRGLELKARTVKLSDETVERAKALGDGNLSEGIRRALSPAASAEVDPQTV
jgi:hypothetical protein